MRVSSKQLSDSGANRIAQQNSDLNELQLQVSTGKKVNSPADDPVSVARLFRLKDSEKLVNKYQDNIVDGTAKLQQIDTILSSSNNYLNRIKELTISANNATMGQSEREIIAKEIEESLNALVDLANTNIGGEYIFAGNNTKNKPVVANAAGEYGYTGDDGVRNIYVSENSMVQANETAKQIFFNIEVENQLTSATANGANTGTATINTPTIYDVPVSTKESYTINFANDPQGNLAYSVINNTDPLNPVTVQSDQVYTSGAAIKFDGIEVAITDVGSAPAIGDSFNVNLSTETKKEDIFGLISSTISHLRSGDQEATKLSYNIGVNMDKMANAETIVYAMRADVGSRMNYLESQEETNNHFIMFLKRGISNIEDLDLAKALTELSKKTMNLEATQASFVKVQKLSLFNFIR